MALSPRQSVAFIEQVMEDGEPCGPPGIDLNAAAWRKSSYSDGGPGNCVEVADNIPGTANGWSSFVSALKSGDLPSL